MTVLDNTVRAVSLVAIGWGLAILTQSGCHSDNSVNIDRRERDAAPCPEPAPCLQPNKGSVATGGLVDMDFIEIGTSNFETLIQLASETARGLSVEGLKMYQDQLPDKPNVIKVNAAVSDPKPGETSAKFYYIHPDDIKKHRLPPWLIGCNAVGAPQTEAARILKNRQLEELMKVDTVPVISFQQLVEQYKVGSIGFLKLDVEGHEPVIIRSMIQACERNPQLWPRAIVFEHKHIKKYEKKLVEDLKSHGYYIAAYTTGDHRDYTMVRIDNV